MTRVVEIYSATDPVYMLDRCVWYWLEFEGRSSARSESYAEVLGWAKVTMAEHDACLIDRSDKGSGYLLSTLGK